jgi:ceramide glucosyltransferase
MIFGFAVLATTMLWIVLGAIAIARIRFGKRRDTQDVQPVTVLKPLSGADADLKENLRSFFEQDHRNYQLVFGLERESDPAFEIVTELMRDYPAVHASLVVKSETRARNPKVSNLKKMLAAAEHDLLVISDSNVRAPKNYLRDMVATKLETDAGLVTSVFAGSGEASFGAALENVQLNGFVAAGAALPTMLSDAAVVGKSMLFSRRELESLGGLDRVSDVLAEDFIMGKMFEHAGRKVVIAREVLDSVNGKISVKSFFDRQLRWSMMRIRLRPLAFLLEPLVSPLAMLPLAYVLFGPLAFVWAFGLIALRDTVQWIMLRGPKRAYLPLFLSPIREVFVLGVWVATPFKKHISWRGHRVRVGAGTLLFHTI